MGFPFWNSSATDWGRYLSDIPQTSSTGLSHLQVQNSLIHNYWQKVEHNISSMNNVQLVKCTILSLLCFGSIDHNLIRNHPQWMLNMVVGMTTLIIVKITITLACTCIYLFKRWTCISCLQSAGLTHNFIVLKLKLYSSKPLQSMMRTSRCRLDK